MVTLRRTANLLGQCLEIPQDPSDSAYGQILGKGGDGIRLPDACVEVDGSIFALVCQIWSQQLDGSIVLGK